MVYNYIIHVFEVLEKCEIIAIIEKTEDSKCLKNVEKRKFLDTICEKANEYNCGGFNMLGQGSGTFTRCGLVEISVLLWAMALIPLSKLAEASFLLAAFR